VISIAAVCVARILELPTPGFITQARSGINEDTVKLYLYFYLTGDLVRPRLQATPTFVSSAVGSKLVIW
jgi:hypothetical protein